MCSPRLSFLTPTNLLLLHPIVPLFLLFHSHECLSTEQGLKSRWLASLRLHKFLCYHPRFWAFLTLEMLSASDAQMNAASGSSQSSDHRGVSLFQPVTVMARVMNVTLTLSCIVPRVTEVTAATAQTTRMGPTASDAWTTTTEMGPVAAVCPAVVTQSVSNKCDTRCRHVL